MEVGKRYRASKTEATCLAIVGERCWMQSQTKQSEWIDKVSEWTEIREPREFWVVTGDGPPMYWSGDRQAAEGYARSCKGIDGLTIARFVEAE